MLIYFINEYWKMTFFDHCWAYLPRNFRNKRCNWAKNRKGLDINKSVVKNKDHCIIFAVGGVTEKRDFWSFFCHFWQFWLPNTWACGRKDFKFSRTLNLICIHTICKNKKIDEFLGRSTPPKKQYFFQKFNFWTFFGIYLLPYNGCK